MRFFSKWSGQNVDVVDNALQICNEISSLEEALTTGRSGIQGNIDFLTSFQLGEEDPLNLLRERLVGMDYSLGNLQEALDQLRTHIRSDLREDYTQLEHREKGAQRVYAYYLPQVREACPGEDQVASLRQSIRESQNESLELDLACINILTVCLDSIRRFPDDLAEL